MFSHLKEDYGAYRRALLSQGFWALQVHRFGAARLRFGWRIVRIPWAILHLILSKACEVFFGIYLGAHAKIGRRLVIEHFGGIIVHTGTVIGDDVTLRQGVTIGNRYLERPHDAPRIGDRVNIGAGAKLLGAIRIGDDVAIGANAVVLCDVPDGHIAAGVPATVRARKDRSSATP